MKRSGANGAVGMLLLTLTGCAEPPPDQAERAALQARAEDLAKTLGAAPVDAAAVVVRLAFDADVDLDLYVTDPLLETVYFARDESRTGGRLVRDVRCDSPGPRVEEVRFETPWPGRYRVGVDYPRRCADAADRAPAPYAVTVYAAGQTYRATGLAELERFAVRVLEFELGGDS